MGTAFVRRLALAALVLAAAGLLAWSWRLDGDVEVASNPPAVEAARAAAPVAGEPVEALRDDLAVARPDRPAALGGGDLQTVTADGVPVSSSVRAYDTSTWELLADVRTDASGYGELDVPAEHVLLLARGEVRGQYAAGVADVVRAEGVPARVLMHPGRAAMAVAVEPRSGGAGDWSVGISAPDDRRRDVTAGDGLVLAEALPPGRTWMSVGRGRLTSWADVRETRAGDVELVRVAVEDGRVHVLVRNLDEYPDRGRTTVSLTRVGHVRGQRGMSWRLESGNTCEFAGVSGGEYQLELTSESGEFAPVKRIVQVEDGEITELVIDLQEAPTVILTAVDALTGRRCGGPVRVVPVGFEGAGYEGFCGVAQLMRAVMIPMPVGRSTILVENWEYGVGIAEVDLRPGELRNVEVVLGGTSGFHLLTVELRGEAFLDVARRLHVLDADGSLYWSRTFSFDEVETITTKEMRNGVEVKRTKEVSSDPGARHEVEFHGTRQGGYAIRVVDKYGVTLASGSVELYADQRVILEPID